MNSNAELKRSLSLWLVIFYGLGTILGAGIYVLVGKVVVVSGMYAPLAFLMAAMIAGFSAFSYAELSSRYPKSAGEAVYIRQGLRLQSLAIMTGLMVILVGMVSSATIAKGFVGYLEVFIDIPEWLALTLLVTSLGFLAFWGISESVTIASFVTLMEVAGLLLILWIARDSLAQVPDRLPELLPSFSWQHWQGITLGAFLAFYAYIGFEDMVNVAEEVKDVSRTLPRAIVIVLFITSFIYIAVALAVVMTLPPADMLAEKAPLARVYENATGQSPVMITFIAVFAVINGALIQIIMASRVLYGMSRQGWLPEVMASVHPRTRTPHISTGLVSITILVLALWLPLVTLARVTSFITLIIFALVNLSLLRIKSRYPLTEGVVTYPVWVPWIGFISSLGFVLLEIWNQLS